MSSSPTSPTPSQSALEMAKELNKRMDRIVAHDKETPA